MYTIVEINSTGKVNAELNEDGWVATPDYVAVIDGSTSKGSHDYGGKKSGRLAMEIIREAISLLRPDCGIRECADELSLALANYYVQHHMINEVASHTENRLTASVVIFSVNRKEVWQIGDCPCMIGNNIFENPKYWELPMAQARALFLENELRMGKSVSQLESHDTGRAYIYPLLRNSTFYQNKEDEPEYAFPVIDGFTIPPHLLKTYEVGEEKEIILATDGYLKLFPTLQETEDYTLQYLSEDPLCIRQHKMTKGRVKGQQSFDDRTYLRIKI